MDIFGRSDETDPVDEPADGSPLLPEEEMARHLARWADELEDLPDLLRRAQREGRRLPIDHLAITPGQLEADRLANAEAYRRARPSEFPTRQERTAERRVAWRRRTPGERFLGRTGQILGRVAVVGVAGAAIFGEVAVVLHVWNIGSGWL